MKLLRFWSWFAPRFAGLTFSRFHRGSRRLSRDLFGSLVVAPVGRPRQIVSIHALILLLCAACVTFTPSTPRTGPYPNQPVTHFLAVWAITNTTGTPIVGAHVTVTPTALGAPATFPDTNKDGRSGVIVVQGDYTVTVTAAGFIPATVEAVTVDNHTDVTMQMDALMSRDRLRLWKGDFCGVPFPSPIGKPIIYTPMYPVYDGPTRAAMRAAYKARGYTHWPISVAGGYVENGHEVYPRFDYSQRPDDFRVFLNELWNDGLIPVVFLMDDHGPHSAGYLQHFIDVNRDLLKVTAIGFELNDWLSPAEGTQAAKDLRKMLGPDPLLYVHLTPQHGALCNTDGCEPGWWKSLRGIVTGNLYQEFPQTDLPHFQQNVKDFVARLSGGYWGFTDMDVVAFEYQCFRKFRGQASEQVGIDQGKAAMQVPGLKGFGDGGPR